MESYELFDSRGKGIIDATGLGEAMKILGYEVDKKQVQEMLAALDESGNGSITKDEFKKFMTARLVNLLTFRTIETIQRNCDKLLIIMTP